MLQWTKKQEGYMKTKGAKSMIKARFLGSMLDAITQYWLDETRAGFTKPLHRYQLGKMTNDAQSALFSNWKRINFKTTPLEAYEIIQYYLIKELNYKVIPKKSKIKVKHNSEI